MYGPILKGAVVNVDGFHEILRRCMTDASSLERLGKETFYRRLYRYPNKSTPMPTHAYIDITHSFTQSN